jgi:hypothetical protein
VAVNRVPNLAAGSVKRKQSIYSNPKQEDFPSNFSGGDINNTQQQFNLLLEQAK